MPNIIQQLRAEYEASTGGEWAVFARQSYMPQEEEEFLGYEIDGPAQPTRGQFVRRADAAFCVAAHNRMPLLLAALEAAAALLERPLEVSDREEWPWCPFCYKTLDWNFESGHAKNCPWVVANTAIASLLKEE